VGGMKIRMTSFILLLLLAAATVSLAIVAATGYMDKYKALALLRNDPAENGSLRINDLKSALKGSDIWMLGDSRMARWNTEQLNADFNIVNLGIEGQTSSQVYCRFRNYLETDTPVMIILEVGINDLKIIGIDKKIAGSTVENYYRNIQSMINLCRDRDIKMILISIFPEGKIDLLRRFVWNRHIEDAVSEANKWLKSYCDHELIFFFDAFSLLSEDGKSVINEYRSDFLHINGKGYEMLNRELVRTINNLNN
jgi:lysophospholipase L1-like esterase